MSELVNAILTIVEQTQNNLYLVFGILGALWIAFFLTILSGRTLLILGIFPRNPFGLLGIIFSPLLHANFNHIFFNSIPLFLLSDFMLIDGVEHFINTTIYITLISGLLTWLFGRKAIHIGASGLITGYWSYLVINSYHTGGVMAIILGIICIYYFAGIFFGIFPSEKGVSWEGHLFGFIAGIIVNYGLNYLPNLAVFF